MANSRKNKNPYFVDVTYFQTSPHYILSKINEVPPLLYTVDLVGCVGIGFIYYEKNQVVKMGVYHSFGEHGNDQFSHKLTKMIKEFFSDVNDSKNVRIIISFTDEMIHEYEANLIKEMIDAAAKERHLSPTTKNNYNVVIGDPTFCLLSDGTFYSTLTGNHAESIAQHILLIILSEIKDKIAKDKTLFPFYSPIIDLIKQVNADKKTWLEAGLLVNEWAQKNQIKNEKNVISKKPLFFYLTKL